MANRMGVVGRCGKQKARFIALMGHVKRFEVYRSQIFTDFYGLVDSMFRYLNVEIKQFLC